MNEQGPKRHDKFRAYRARKKAQGLKQIRMWVPDVNAPGFKALLEREVEILRASRTEKEALDFIEAAIADDPELYD